MKGCGYSCWKGVSILIPRKRNTHTLSPGIFKLFHLAHQFVRKPGQFYSLAIYQEYWLLRMIWTECMLLFLLLCWSLEETKYTLLMASCSCPPSSKGRWHLSHLLSLLLLPPFQPPVRQVTPEPPPVTPGLPLLCSVTTVSNVELTGGNSQLPWGKFHFISWGWRLYLRKPPDNAAAVKMVVTCGRKERI